VSPGRRLGHTVHALGAVESTQVALGRLAVAGAPEGTVVTAVHQTGGRGRRDRSWWDEPGQSVLCSVLLRPAVATARVPQLSLVAGLAVAEALEEAAPVAAGIKWPNDVLLDGLKVAGVLAEAVSAPDGSVRHVLLGIGINVNQTRFPDPLGTVATSLRLAAGGPHDPAAVLARALDRLAARYDEWQASGLRALLEAWRRRSVTLGRGVSGPDGQAGLAEDVAEDGALLVRLADGTLARVVTAAAEP
jgi:BirA family biotin operon repressor/biotin-[acetyl-CoA-carboxylase] ligase